MKKILIIVGPSGTGKTTLGNYLKELGWVEFISHTTRKIRETEIPDVDYHFVSKEKFMETEKVEYTQYAGNYYGLSVKEVDEKINKYNNCYCIVEKNGALNLRKIYPYAKVIFVYNTPKVLKERMKERGGDENVIKNRINNIFRTKELENYKYADIIIRNSDLNVAKKQIDKALAGNMFFNNLIHKIYLTIINVIYKFKISCFKN